MNLLSPDDQPACLNSGLDPDWWFPESPGQGKHAQNLPEYQVMIEQSVQAMTVCNDCPLMLNGKCIDYAMSDTTTIDFGIFAGTLPFERRGACGSPTIGAGNGLVFQVHIRKAADKAGLIKPLIPRQERPRPSFYDYFGKDTSSASSLD